MHKLDALMKLKPCWEYLSETDLPVFIYGMGDGCLKLMREFEKYNIAVAGIFASDEFVRGHSFEGHLVHKLSEIEDTLGCGNFVIALGFAAGYQSLIEKIDNIKSRNILFVPDTDAIGVGAFTRETLCENIESIKQVYDHLADDKSREVYYNVLAYKITGDIEYLKSCTTTPREAYENILKLTDNEVYVDLGAYNGDTIREFLQYTNNHYRLIYAMEPNIRNFKKLSLSVEMLDNVQVFNAAAWDKEDVLIFDAGGGRQSQVSKKGVETRATSVDIILNGEKASYIKYDVEGAEEKALKGAENTIIKYSPKLCVALYHRAEDIFKIPLQVLSMNNNNYKLYIRHFPYYPAWETNLFAVCE